jgi:hypothetical protein
MALSQKHRSNLYRDLAPIVGEEEAEALLSQFPSRDLDEPVTKEFVRAEISDVRAEIGGLRAEMHSEIGGLRAEMHRGFADINEKFRQQTIWIASATVVAVGIAAGLGRL